MLHNTLYTHDKIRLSDDIYLACFLGRHGIKLYLKTIVLLTA